MFIIQFTYAGSDVLHLLAEYYSDEGDVTARIAELRENNPGVYGTFAYFAGQAG